MTKSSLYLVPVLLFCFSSCVTKLEVSKKTEENILQVQKDVDASKKKITEVKETLDGISSKLDSVNETAKNIQEELTSDVLVDTNNVAKQSFRLFTHFEKIDDDLPSGTLQTELYCSWPVNSNIWYPGKKKDKKSTEGIKTVVKLGYPHVIFFRNLILPNFQITNFDGKSYAVPIRRDSADITKKLINTFDLVQHSFFNNTAKINIVTLTFKNFKIQLDGTFNHYRTYVIDSIPNSIYTQKVPVNSIGYGWNLRFKTDIKDSKFQVSASISSFYLKLMKNIYTQVQGIRYDDDKTPLTLDKDYVEKSVSPVIIGTTELSYNKKVWLRFAYYSNYLSGNLGGYKFNDFFQVQTGININVEDIIDVFKGDDNKSN